MAGLNRHLKSFVYHERTRLETEIFGTVSNAATEF